MNYYSDITDRAWVEVDCAAFAHNLKAAQAHAGGKPVMCVIKGDAHGHGAAQASVTLASHGAYGFAQACLDEAVNMRLAVDNPILILGYTPIGSAHFLKEYNLEQTILDLEYARALNAEAARGKYICDVHIKLDTGMTRLGIFAQGASCHKAAIKDVCEIFKLKNLHVRGIFTHFAAADMPERDLYTKWQLENYNAIVDGVLASGIEKTFDCHTSNSAGILFHPEARFDMVRAGAMLYGVNPRNIPFVNGPLQEALTMKARVAQVKTVPAGTLVSYTGLYETKTTTQVAVIAAGFADAYMRELTGKGAYAVINGHKCPQIGKVCMDMCMFDVTGCDVKRDDIAILYGRGGISLDQMAQMSGMLNLEPTCLLTKRVRVQYMNAE